MAEEVTSQEIAKLAADYLNIKPSELAAHIGGAIAESPTALAAYLSMLCVHIRTLAGSALAQTPSPIIIP